MQILTKYNGGSLGHAPSADALISPKDAVVLHREFMAESAVTGHTYTLTGSPSVTRSTTVASGAFVIASNATAAAYAVNSTSVVAQAAADRVIMFEARVAVTSVSAANAAQFVGLNSSATLAPITVAGVPDGTRSCIGFSFVEGEIKGVFGSAAGGVITLATGNTAGTFRRLGFVVKGTSSIEFYVDGVLSGTATTVPTTVMYESYSNASGVQQGCTVDYMHLAYTR